MTHTASASGRHRLRLCPPARAPQVHGAQWADAHVRAERVAAGSGGALVHPFEGADTWDGHASLVEECAAQRRALLGEGAARLPPAAVLVSVGGGGLLLGVLKARGATSLRSPPNHPLPRPRTPFCSAGVTS